MVLELLRNDNLIPENFLADYFTLKSGKFFDWRGEGTRRTQINNYKNLCKELGLIKIYNDNIYK